jgi:hypothetical protein
MAECDAHDRTAESRVPLRIPRPFARTRSASSGHRRDVRERQSVARCRRTRSATLANFTGLAGKADALPDDLNLAQKFRELRARWRAAAAVALDEVLSA